MVSSARVAYLSNRSKDYGVDLEKPVKMNMEAVRKRKRDIVSSFRGGSESRIQKTKNLELYMGQARFVGSKEIEITLNDQRKSRKLLATQSSLTQVAVRLSWIFQVPMKSMSWTRQA